KPRTDVSLPPTAEAAIAATEKWASEGNPPAAGPDGRVVYAYGAGQPILVCAPLRLCAIELEPGEHLVGVPQISDSLRWRVLPASYGKGNEATTVLVVKPLNTGLDATLIITTDLRPYYLRLLSKAEDFTARVAFNYDEQPSDLWGPFLAKREDNTDKAHRDDRL